MRSISTTSRNKTATINNNGKSSSRLVHSIASGLKKSTKIFKKGSSSRAAAAAARSAESLSPVNCDKKRLCNSKLDRRGEEINENYGSFRTGRRRRRRRKQRKNGDDGASFSSPERKSLLNNQIMQPLSPSSIIQRKHHSPHGMSMPAHSMNTRDDGHDDDTIQAKVLRNFEYAVRQVLIYVAIYLYGAYQPFTLLSNDTVLQIAHYLLIVWGTAVVIRVMIYYATMHENEKESRENIVEQLMFSDEERGRQLPEEEDIIDTEVEPLMESPIHEHEREHDELEENDTGREVDHNPHDNQSSKMYSSKKLSSNIFSPFEKGKNVISPQKEVIDDSLHSEGSDHDISEQSWTQVDKIIGSDQPQEHPELEDLFLIDKVSNERVHPNGEPIAFDNELFSGHSLLMFRTSDADTKDPPDGARGSAKNDIVSDYLRNKKRRFEIQMQFKFKKLPDSPLFMCCDLDDPIKLGLVQRAFVKATLNFVQQKNPTLSYCLSGYDKVSEEDRKAGKYENPHIAFPVETTLDRLVVTKPGEQPPRLGENVHEDPEAMAIRKRGISYNLSDTYTFCIWSAYVDFLSWKAVNLPAIRPFSIANVNGAQPTSLKFYLLKSTSGKHLQCHMDTVFDIELSHRQITSLGNGTRKWIEKRIQDKTIDSIAQHAKGNELNVAVDRYNNLDSYNVDVDDDILSSDMEVDEGSQAPSDSDLDMLDGIDDRILGDDPALAQNANESQHKEMMLHFDFCPDDDGKYNQNSQNEVVTQLPHTEVKKFNIDTLSWVEMMHRKRRKPQRVYAVRMVRQTSNHDLSNEENHTDDEIDESKSFFRLRTGKQLSALLRLGLELGVQMLNGEAPKR